MKTVLTLFSFLFTTSISFGQVNLGSLKKGDILSINKKHNSPFHHIHFPKTNFIAKRGVVVNYKSLDGIYVKIEELYVNKTVLLIPLNGERFFKKYSYVTADLEEALQSGELELLGQKK